MYGNICKSLLCLIALAIAMPSSAKVDWSEAPMLKPERVKGGDRRSQSLFRPINLEVDEIVEYTPTDSTSTARTLESFGDGRFLMNTSGRGEGNYHWVQGSSVDGARFASTVHYFSNPGPAPRKLLRQNKIQLEIRPVDLPREHRRFRANETWAFEVLWEEKPLTGASISLETSNGTVQTLATDDQGVFKLTFPDDFQTAGDTHQQHQHHGAKKEKKNSGHSGHRRRSAKFVVTVAHNGITSAFNYKYSPHAFTNKSVLPAVGLLFGGSLITGAFLFRRRSA